jgi:hypothetical protein
MSRRKPGMRSVLLAAGALVLMSGVASADEVYSARTAITLPGTQKITSFDISFVDPVIGLYLLADRTNKVVNVIDTTTNTVLVQLTATPPFAGATPSNDNAGPDGVITVTTARSGRETARAKSRSSTCFRKRPRTLSTQAVSTGPMSFVSIRAISWC